MANHQINLVNDRRTRSVINELKEQYNVTTDAGVVRKALALARLCIRMADNNGVVTFINPDGTENKISLRS